MSISSTSDVLLVTYIVPRCIDTKQEIPLIKEDRYLSKTSLTDKNLTISQTSDPSRVENSSQCENCKYTLR